MWYPLQPENKGKILFCGSDVAKSLGYARPNEAITQHCKEDGTAFRRITDSLGRPQEMSFISEGDLYRLILIMPEYSKMCRTE